MTSILDFGREPVLDHTGMLRAIAALLALAASFAIAPGLRAAPLRTGLRFAFAQSAPAGDHLWCVFPDRESQWTVVMYERGSEWHWYGPRTTFTPLAEAIKPAGAYGNAYYQMMTIPPHSGRDCLLVAFRNGVQQPYRGWTPYNPFGWYIFGVVQPLQTLVAEIPPGTPAADIANYERTMRAQWSRPLH